MTGGGGGVPDRKVDFLFQVRNRVSFEEEETSKKSLTFFYFGGQTYFRRPFLLALVRGLGR